MKKRELSYSEKLTSLIVAAAVMSVGLILFKFLPMKIFGREILFDASMHLIVGIFVLYVLWYFVDQNKSWRIPYLFFAAVVVLVISVQRVMANAHNDIGLLAGFIISAIAIIVSRLDYFKDKFSF